MLLQSEHDLVLLLGVASLILLALAILGGVVASLKSFQVRQFQDLLFKAERKIDTLERRMFNVLNAVPVALVETDATGKFTFANKAAHQLLGRKDNELLGLRFHSATWGITYPDGRVVPADLLPIARTLRGQTVKGFQHLLTRYGTQQKMLVSVTSMPVMNSIGEVIGSSAAFVELETARGEGIDDLNGLWRGHWFEAATLPFWGLDASGKILDINTAACETFSLTREQVLGDSWAQSFVSEADFQAAMDYLTRLQEDSVSGNISTTLRLRSPRGGDDTTARVTAWRVRTHEGGEHGMTVMALAVEPAQASVSDEDAVQELADHREAEQVRAAMGIGLWRYDPEADAIVEDEGMRRLIGRETEGGPTLIAPEDQARADEAFGDLVKGGRDEIALEIPVRHPEGVRWISLTGRAETAADGQRRLFGAAHDVTRWHRESAETVTQQAPGISEADHIAALNQAETRLHQSLAALETRHAEALAVATAEAEATARAEAEAEHAEALATHLYGWQDAPPPAAPEPVVLHEADPAVVAENAALKQRLAALEADLDTMRTARNALQVELHEVSTTRPVELDAELEQARAEAARLRDRVAELEAAPQDTSAQNTPSQARIEALERDLAESRSLLAALERRYVALSENAPEPETEARLRQLTEALDAAQKYETVGRLTSNVAHDFAQMLNVINGALEVMARPETSPDNLRRLSEAALAAGKRGERLTRQLQAFQAEEF